MNKKEKQKAALKRELLNKHLPYEVYALATMRYYAQLQDLGAIDVVSIMMHIEAISEEEALQRCMNLLKDLQMTQAGFVANCIEVLGSSPIEERMKNELRAYHKNN